MAARKTAETVASALNNLTDSAFTDLLSARDNAALMALVQNYFCAAPEDNDDDGNGENLGMSLS